MGKLRFLIAVIVGKILAFLLDKIFKRGKGKQRRRKIH